jgi:hypothetical protein
MTGNTKLPSMTIPLLPNTTREQAVELADLLYHLGMGELVSDIVVRERLVTDSANASGLIFREYDVSISLSQGTSGMLLFSFYSFFLLFSFLFSFFFSKPNVNHII